MTGSGSAIIAYFLSKKHCRDAEKKLKNNLEITGVKYQKLYKFIFCDMIILGRSQAVRHGFLYLHPRFDPSTPAKYEKYIR